MSTKSEAVLQDALRLPAEERSLIASRLIESVDEADDAEVSFAWREEILRRVQAARAGQARRIAHDEVIAGARALLANARDAQA